MEAKVSKYGRSIVRLCILLFFCAIWICVNEGNHIQKSKTIQKQPTALKYLLIKHENSQKQNGLKCTNDNPT